MTDELIEIPIFPLGLVLFPGMVQPLHIFEPRYREMTRFCLDSNVPFGITLAMPGSTYKHEIPARMGSLARITGYHRLPDGRYNLLTAGAQRFEIVELKRDKPYLCALARLLPEETGAGEVEELAREARVLVDEYLSLILALLENNDKTISVPDDPIELSYFTALCLPCEDGVKQELLEAPDACGRLEREIELLRREITAIREADGDDEEPYTPVSTVEAPDDHPPFGRVYLN